MTEEAFDPFETQLAVTALASLGESADELMRHSGRLLAYFY